LALSVYTIAPENRFLRVLARAVLAGFPIGKSVIPLSRWTILLPTRRSARALEMLLLEESGAKALLLPKIKPIGDIDENEIADQLPLEGIADGLSKQDHLHAILLLVMQWAQANPASEIAGDVLASGAQAFALAQSLQELVNQFETEDVDVEALKSVYTPDLAGHRQNILQLLEVVTKTLPLRLEAENRMGPAARRNQLIRLEAARIAAGKLKGPVIAAGSTGTNPATRDLLKAIAGQANGAVVLPGLDLTLDASAWNEITSEHPQFSLKTMLQQWEMDRTAVNTLGDDTGPRQRLMGFAMRPAAVAEHWTETLRGAEQEVVAGLQGVRAVAATDRQEEAEIIALRLRQYWSEGTGRAALITPDRDLATRVKAALRRWNLSIDDSAGEPLVHQGQAALLLLLLRAVQENFSAATLFPLLHHTHCQLGMTREEHLGACRALELVGFRGLPEAEGLSHLHARIALRHKAIVSDPHVHPLLAQMSDASWQKAIALSLQLDALLTPLRVRTSYPLAEHVSRLLEVLQALSPPVEQLSPGDQLFHEVMLALKTGSAWHPVLPLAQAQHSIVHALAQETLRPRLDENSKLAIYGLAEARLIDVELAILGGLVEGSWPAQPDTGPWLNRPMRESLKLQQPEREIGVTAHDMVQGFGHPEVLLTWPKRLQSAPVLPARWILRLETVVSAAGLKAEIIYDKTLQNLRRGLDVPRHFKPQTRPILTPPVALRPTRFSVSRVEKLVRDSYWIYVHDILKLLPLDEVGEDIDASLRGSLIHAALQAWAAALPSVPASESHALLLAKGRSVFEPYMDMPEVARFWWPRFVRMADDFEKVDRDLRRDVLSWFTEVRGQISFEVSGVVHKLSARADRIDVLSNGALRIIDYKSGSVPSLKTVLSGFAPQLTLEAAIARRGGFENLNSQSVADALYMSVGGSSKGVDITSLAKMNDVEAEAEKALVGLLELLTAFQQQSTAYIPRHNLQRQEDISDYDHLSRRLEWQLQGTAP
jgi:ATP-dependent helicase/nuclease subunit B